MKNYDSSYLIKSGYFVVYERTITIRLQSYKTTLPPLRKMTDIDTRPEELQKQNKLFENAGRDK